MTTSYDSAGRVSSVAGGLGDNTSRTYASGLSYAASGALQQEQFGTDTPLYHKLLYNSRSQLAEIRVGTASLPDTGWQRGAIVNDYSDTAWGVSGGGPDNSGNLHRQKVYVPNVEGAGYDQNWSGYTQTYTYDALNRLSSASESSAASWTQVYSYDRYGNRALAPGTTYPQMPTDPATNLPKDPARNPVINPANNRIDAAVQGQGGYAYDGAGNLLCDPGHQCVQGQSSLTPYYAYDAMNRMTGAGAAPAAGGASYSYDGDGRRVRRNVVGAETWQVYGLGGELLAEYPAGAQPSSPREEYGYRGGELLMTATVTGGWGPAPAFADDPLIGANDPQGRPATAIRLVHLTDLRSAVNQLRQHAGLAPFDFTVDPDPQQNVTTVKAEHIRQLRAALEEARTRLGLSTGGYFQPTLAEHTSLIYAKDFQELRDQIRGAWQSGAGVDLRWLVADQLGTPRMVIDKTGSLAGAYEARLKIAFKTEPVNAGWLGRSGHFSNLRLVRSGSGDSPDERARRRRSKPVPPHPLFEKCMVG